MTATIQVFVNERRVELPAGSAARGAVAALDPVLLARLDAGEAYLTDGRGIRLDSGAPLTTGGIIRVVVTARRGPRADA